MKKQASRVRMSLKKGREKKARRRKRIFKLSFPFKRKMSKYTTSKRSSKRGSKYILLFLLFLAILTLLYLSMTYVLNVRKNAFNTIQGEVGKVIGLEEIPTYPGSTFIFSNDLNDPIVKEFISLGNSAYRLPSSTSTEDLEDYYSNEMDKYGWQFIQNIPLNSPDKKYGMYWSKDGKGLRIYSKYKDIWYESITLEDAQSGLANLVKDEIEREMLMATSEKQDLLPDYPWKIQIPKEYIIKYSPTDMGELRAVSFQQMGSDDTVEIYPVGYWKAKELDYFLVDYCELKSTQDISYGVLNSVPISFKGTIGLKSTLKVEGGVYLAYTVANPYNSVVYVISSNNESNPLLEYIIENVEPMGAKE